jgi:hypothetical protein
MASWFNKLNIKGTNAQPTSSTESTPSSTTTTTTTTQVEDDVQQNATQGQQEQPRFIRQGLSGIGGFFANVATKIITTLEEEKDHFLQERETPDPLSGGDHEHSDEIILPLWLAIEAENPQTIGTVLISISLLLFLRGGGRS